MDREEIKQRQEEIAKMLGWFQEEKGNALESWFKRTDCAICVAYSEHSNYPYRDLPFNRDYKYLMEAIEFIRNIQRLKNIKDIKEGDIILGDFALNRDFVLFSLFAVHNGLALDKTVLIDVTENGKDSYMNALFIAVSDVAKFYNNNKLNGIN